MGTEGNFKKQQEIASGIKKPSCSGVLFSTIESPYPIRLIRLQDKSPAEMKEKCTLPTELKIPIIKYIALASRV